MSRLSYSLIVFVLMTMSVMVAANSTTTSTSSVATTAVPPATSGVTYVVDRIFNQSSICTYNVATYSVKNYRVGACLTDIDPLFNLVFQSCDGAGLLQVNYDKRDVTCSNPLDNDTTPVNVCFAESNNPNNVSHIIVCSSSPGTTAVPSFPPETSAKSTTTTTITTTTTVVVPPTSPTPPVPTPAPVTTTTAPPTTGNQCQRVTFANGSYVPFTDIRKLTGYFPSIQQTGVDAGSRSWSVSLCDPSIVSASGGQLCTPFSYLSESGCSTTYPTLNFQTIHLDLVGFTYIRRINETLSHYAYVYCGCDPQAINELVAPTNSYFAFNDPSGNLIEMWRVASAECCAVNPTTTLSSTTGTVTSRATSSGKSTTTTSAASSANSTSSAPTETSASASGNNNNNNNNGAANGGGDGSNNEQNVRTMGFAALGGALGVIFVGFVYFVVRWISSRQNSATAAAPGENFRSAYEYPLNDQAP